MKYLLVVGFHCAVYRKEPRARLFFNDQLIDEFNIKHKVENKDVINPLENLKHQLEPCEDWLYNEYLKNKLPPLRFYDIDVDDQVQQVSLKIDIDNDDNNYTNGFITKFTNLRLSVLSLLPMDRKIFECLRLKACEQKFTTEKYSWHRKTKRNNFFHLVGLVSWTGKNGQKFNNIDFNIGGSGNFYCELIKKYRILLGKLKCPEYAYIYNLHYLVNKVLYDKYEQHENQRNTD
jgi:hypothetical protein